jgi:hypothetical protein
MSTPAPQSDSLSSPAPAAPQATQQVSMTSLALVSGLTHVPVFRFVDEQYQPLQSELLVSRANHWAVATEQPQSNPKNGGPLQLGAPSLAANICREYEIEPADLTLFARYVYSGGYESLYAVHFASGTRDLFEGIRFIGIMPRELLKPEQVTELMHLLHAGQPAPAMWRAIPGKK